MILTENELRLIIRQILLEAQETDEEDSEAIEEEPMGDESKVGKAYKIAKTAYSFV